MLHSLPHVSCAGCRPCPLLCWELLTRSHVHHWALGGGPGVLATPDRCSVRVPVATHRDQSQISCGGQGRVEVTLGGLNLAPSKTKAAT